MKTKAVKRGGPTEPVVEPPADSQFTEQLAKLAYVLWEERGCPHGSPDADWYQAEREMTEKK